MLQSFEDISDTTKGAARVAALRKPAADGLDGFLVPRADEHQGEYVPKCAARLYWLTGFSGSAGSACVLAHRAALFVDGRYTVQARQQVDATVFEIRQVPEAKLSDWLVASARKGDRIGYDPRLHTVSAVEGLAAALKPKEIALVAVTANPVDAIWSDRPEPPIGAVVPHPGDLAGVAATAKLGDLRQALTQAGESAVVLTAPDSLCWLFNIRGSDLEHTPFALGFAIVPVEGKAQLYIDPRKIGDNVRGHLAEVAELRAPDELEAGLTALGAARAKVRLDPEATGQWFADCLAAAGAVVSRGPDPCLLPKARKNSAEIAGARRAHALDAVAMCRFLAWLDREAPGGGLDEIAATKRLEDFRRDTGELEDTSFDTIAGAGPHAAMPHYRVSTASNRRIERNSIFLVDSGGQYRCGTTDITRTVAVGKLPREAQVRFTLVLKGMIAVSTARFPKGTRGADLDVLARRALWAAGLDFDHGTGHGVGSFLSVHEGPQRIARTGMVPLEPGMIVSNEPGYYKEGAYGIRIENLLLVEQASVPDGGERPMLGFETLSFAPIDRRLIVKSMLLPDERAWLDRYHAAVLEKVGPKLDAEDRAWLEAACRSL